MKSSRSKNSTDNEHITAALTLSLTVCVILMTVPHMMSVLLNVHTSNVCTIQFLRNSAFRHTALLSPGIFTIPYFHHSALLSLSIIFTLHVCTTLYMYQRQLVRYSFFAQPAKRNIDYTCAHHGATIANAVYVLTLSTVSLLVHIGILYNPISSHNSGKYRIIPRGRSALNHSMVRVCHNSCNRLPMGRVVALGLCKCTNYCRSTMATCVGSNPFATAASSTRGCVP